VLEGVITLSARGDQGFGYDPVFQPSDGDGRTLAEFSAEEKNQLSHRARALRALSRELAN
jgi:XTP/dITP diphosphohydrolase